MQLAQESLPVRINLALAVVIEGTGRPAPGHNGNQHIGLRQHIGNVIGLILNLMLVRSKTRCKIVIAHLASVQHQLIHTERGCMNPRPLQRLADRKGAAEGHWRRRLFLRIIIASIGDPLRLPRGIQTPGLKGGHSLGRFTACPYRKNMYWVRGVRHQFSIIQIVDLIGCFP
ncbi:hypothetical protein D3C71_1682240 [compost metagenome]